MELFSEYLEKNITFPDSTDSEVQPHQVLMEIIHYKLKANVHYTMLTDKQNIGMMCTISDSQGRRVEGLGDAGRKNLTTEISQSYPLKMAAKRAFDNAAVLFLLLPQKEFNRLYDSFEEKEEEREQKRMQKTAESGSQHPTQTSRPSEKTQNNSAQGQRPSRQQPANKDFRQVVVVIGRHKQEGLTIAELADIDIESLKWMTEYRTNDPRAKECVWAAKRWLEEYGEQSA